MADNKSHSSEVLKQVVSERVATLTLSRPDSRNALNRELLDQLSLVLDELNSNELVDVIVITAEDPVFCAGLDLRELEPGGSLDLSLLIQGGVPWPKKKKPWIGAINGAAVTGGLELALACDFLIASDQARFADTHSRVGIQPFWGLSVLLPQAVGVRFARQMSATGNFVDAQEALRVGLVNEVVPHSQLLDRAMEIASDVASNDQLALQVLFDGYNETTRLSFNEAFAAEHLRAFRWQGSEANALKIAERREAITQRGRSQSENQR